MNLLLIAFIAFTAYYIIGGIVFVQISSIDGVGVPEIRPGVRDRRLTQLLVWTWPVLLTYFMYLLTIRSIYERRAHKKSKEQ